MAEEQTLLQYLLLLLIEMLVVVEVQLLLVYLEVDVMLETVVLEELHL
tara:strand:+ start:329 stop:472 length:144 start_codon:yes stop_codon:yes gene_type:complete